MCGFTRWIKVCRKHIKDDPENGAKMFQIVMMILFGLVSVGLIALIYLKAKQQIGDLYFWLPLLGFGIEISIGLLLNILGYFILAQSWEGYYRHRIIQAMHYLSMIFVSTIIPHGDFLLHMGYLHKGYNKANEGIEEPFPDGFEIPKEPTAYKGYLKAQTRGGHFFFLSFGYAKCVLILIRMSLVLTFYFLQGPKAFSSLLRYAPIILMCLCSYTLFNLMMTIKFFAENTSISFGCDKIKEKLCCCFKQKNKRKGSQDLEEEEEGSSYEDSENEDGII